MASEAVHTSRVLIRETVQETIQDTIQDTVQPTPLIPDQILGNRDSDQGNSSKKPSQQTKDTDVPASSQQDQSSIQSKNPPEEKFSLLRYVRYRFTKDEALGRLDRIKEMMAGESKLKRYMIVGFASGAAVLCFTVSVFWMARADVANRMDAFDVCAQASSVSYLEIYEVCGEDREGCLRDFNTGWVTVFEYNGVVLFFLFMSYVAVAVGAFLYQARLAGGLCTLFWNSCHIIALLVTASYRFSKQGRLCALTDVATSSEEWTFRDDGAVIVNLWGLQLMTFVFICCIGLCPLRVPEPEPVLTKEVVILTEQNTKVIQINLDESSSSSSYDEDSRQLDEENRNEPPLQVAEPKILLRSSTKGQTEGQDP